MDVRYQKLIDQYAAQYGIDPVIAARMLNQESAGDPNAVSKKGASGLMQLMPETAKSLGVTDINDPEQNIKASMQYLASLLKSHNGDYKLALASYNAGPGTVRRAGNVVPDIPETQNYVTRVMGEPQAAQVKKIDWDQVAEQAQQASETPGDASLISPVSKIDWDKIPATRGTTISARPNHPVANWFHDVGEDVRQGTDITLPGKILKGMGAPGTHKGVPPAVGEYMGGPVAGPAEFGHGVTELFGSDRTGNQRVRGANEIFSGVGKTVGPIASVAHPAFIPTVAGYGTAGHLIKTGAEGLGVDPDTADLVSNIAMVGAPVAKKAFGPFGRAMQRSAPTVGRVAGYGGAAYSAYKRGNPLDLFAAHPASKIVSGVTNLAGRGVEAIGDSPLLPHELVKTPGKPVFSSPTQGVATAPTPKPLELNAAPIMMPPVEADSGPMAQSAGSTVVRGKGGRMTKQFLSGPSSPGKGKAWMPPVGEPTAPPSVPEEFRTESVGPKPLINIGEQAKPPVDIPANLNGAEKEAYQSGQAQGRAIMPNSLVDTTAFESASKPTFTTDESAGLNFESPELKAFKENLRNRGAMTPADETHEMVGESLIDTEPLTKASESPKIEVMSEPPNKPPKKDLVDITPFLNEDNDLRLAKEANLSPEELQEHYAQSENPTEPGIPGKIIPFEKPEGPLSDASKIAQSVGRPEDAKFIQDIHDLISAGKPIDQRHIDVITEKIANIKSEADSWDGINSDKTDRLMELKNSLDDVRSELIDHLPDGPPNDLGVDSKTLKTFQKLSNDPDNMHDIFMEYDGGPLEDVQRSFGLNEKQAKDLMDLMRSEELTDDEAHIEPEDLLKKFKDAVDNTIKSHGERQASIRADRNEDKGMLIDFRNQMDQDGKNLLEREKREAIQRSKPGAPKSELIKESKQLIDTKMPEQEKVMFHGTTANKLKSILKNGLKSPYLAEDQLHAEEYADMFAEDRNHEPVVIKVRVPKEHRLTPDEQPGGARPGQFSSEGNIPPDRLEVIRGPKSDTGEKPSASKKVSKKNLIDVPENPSLTTQISSREAKYEQAKKNLKTKLDPNKLNSGVDPTALKDMFDIGRYHVENGIQDFAKWSKTMIEQIGEHVKPHLDNLWFDIQKAVNTPTVEPFYSRAERVAKEKLPNEASGRQMFNTLKNNGVSQEELYHAGLTKLENGEKPISRDEILNRLKTHGLKIEETVRNQSFIEGFDNYLDARGLDRELFDEMDSEMQRDLRDEYNHQNGEDNMTQYHKYQEPGFKENYTETLLRAPTEKLQLPTDPVEKIYRRILNSNLIDDRREYSLEDLQESYGLSEREAKKLEHLIQSDAPMPGGQPTRRAYYSPHWEDDPNVLVHHRTNDRTDLLGRKMRFIEEIQSDLHQEGRKNGYDAPRLPEDTTKNLIREYRQWRELHDLNHLGSADEHFDDPNLTVQERNWLKDYVERWNKAEGYESDDMDAERVPDLPFKKTWHELAFKHILRKAAEDGKEVVGWTTGEQQNKRYNLSQHVDTLNWDPSGRILTAEKDGHQIIHRVVPEEQLPDFVGKELAERLIQNAKDSNKDFRPLAEISKDMERISGFKIGDPNWRPNGGRWEQLYSTNRQFKALRDEWDNTVKGHYRPLKGIDLEVGGKGMKGFYDKILVDTANKLGKKYGVQVKDAEIQGGNELIKDHVGNNEYRPGKMRIHSIDITPQMKKDLLHKGQPIAELHEESSEQAA